MNLLRSRIANIVITASRGQMPAIITTATMNHRLMGENSIDCIGKVAQTVRQKILKKKMNESVQILELNKLIEWILSGFTMSKSEMRNESMKKSIEIITQQILRLTKTNRQIAHVPKSDADYRLRSDTNFTLDLSMWMYQNLRSQRVNDLLYGANLGVSYDRISHVCSAVAIAVNGNIRLHGIYVPHGLVRDIAIRGSCDNIDKKSTPEMVKIHSTQWRRVFIRGNLKTENLFRSP